MRVVEVFGQKLNSAAFRQNVQIITLKVLNFLSLATLVLSRCCLPFALWSDGKNQTCFSLQSTPEILGDGMWLQFPGCRVYGNESCHLSSSQWYQVCSGFFIWIHSLNPSILYRRYGRHSPSIYAATNGQRSEDTWCLGHITWRGQR